MAKNLSLDRLEAEVAEDTSVKQSAIALMNANNKELKAIRAELAESGIDNAKLNSLIDLYDDSTDELAAAVVANTPAADEPPVDEPA